MARLRRVVLPGHPHLIIHRRHSGAPASVDSTDRSLYLHSLRDAARESGVEVHAYALLPTEVRLLVTPSATDGLARVMQSVGRRYVRGYNLRYGRTGSPWEGRFRSSVVEAERYFIACLRFVESPGTDEWGNVEGTMPVADPPFSSLAHHLGGQVDPLIADHPEFWRLGNTPFEREAAYRRLIRERLLPADTARVLHASLNGWVLGSAAFAAAVAEQSGRRSVPGAPGRPRKTK